ncbi:MAG: response regulator [Candidatus Promineifilaceae bacterium]|nr:response regulator [Candidatus Promineifilaceae bacterium]
MAKVLIVDDDAQLLHMVGMMLERGGHTPVLVEEPELALQRIQEEMPDAVIVDVMMPTMSGHDLTRELREMEAFEDLPVLVLTARSQAVDREAALESGANDYLSKPVVPKELMEHLDNLLNQPPKAPGRMTISLFSLRGGVGRTTLAVNLAAALRRVSQEEVCLVDLSPSSGQAAMHLRLQARHTWADLPSVNQLDWSNVKSHLLMHQSGLRLLAAPPEPQLPIAPSGELTTAVLEILRENVAFTIVDLPPLFNPAVQTALEMSDMLLHVVTPEVVSVQIALQSVKAIGKAEIAVKQKAFILNQVTNERQLPAAAVNKGLKTRVAFDVGYDPNQARALAQGVPLSLTPAKSALPATTKRMAGGLWERTGGRAQRDEASDQQQA